MNSVGFYSMRVELFKAFTEVQSILDKYLKCNKDAGRTSPI